MPGPGERAILLVSSFLHPRGGDTSLLFDEWGAWERRGVRVVPFAMRHPDNVVRPEDVRFPPWHRPRESHGLGRLRAGIRSIWNQGAAAALDGFLRDLGSDRPDVAHLHHLHRHLTPAVLPVLKAHGLRVVWTLHDHELTCPTGLRFRDGAACDRCLGGHYVEAVRGRCKDGAALPSLAVAAEKAFHRRIGIQRWVDAFVAPSAFLAASLVADGLPAARVHVVPNFVLETPETERSCSGVVYAGRLTVEKGAAVLVDAARRLADEVVLFGDGPERAALAARAPTNVRFAGQRPRAEVTGALGRAGAVAVPSIWPENLPYAVLEAQSAGAAVVASAVGGIPEMVDSGVDGLLVPPNDPEALAGALRTLTADPALAARIGRAGRQRAASRNEASWVSAMTPLFWPIA